MASEPPADQSPHGRRLAQAQLVGRLPQLVGRHTRRTRVAHAHVVFGEPVVQRGGHMRFEKWQALGNDYILVEETDLPFPLTPRRIERICAPHTGVGSDGILLLSRTDERGFVAQLRIYNPDGSEAELSGNGAREAVMYLRRRGWTDNDTFSLQTAAGEMRPHITSGTTCTMDMGRAKLTSKDFPSGPYDGRGSLEAGGRACEFQHVSIGNPQCSIE